MYDCSFDDLVEQAFQYGKGAESVHDYMIEHAVRSKSFGYNHIGWARIGEAVAKAFLLEHQDARIMTDKFILTLSIKFSDFFRDEIDATYEVKRTH